MHDYQLTAIGNALKYFGYSFNSVDPKELEDAEKLLIESKPHLFAITSDYQPPMRSGDATMSMCWTGDATQLHRDIPEIVYILGKEGGEIWSDFFTIPASAPHKDAAYALIDFLLEPKMAAKEAQFHGYATGDSRVDALLPAEMRESEILYPAAELLNALEFGAAVTHDQSAARGNPRPLQVGVRSLRVRPSLRTALFLAPATAWLLCHAGAAACGGRHLQFRRKGSGRRLRAGFHPRATTPTCGARWAAFKNTMTLAPLGTLMCLLIAYPLAYFLAQKADRALADRVADPGRSCLSGPRS